MYISCRERKRERSKKCLAKGFKTTIRHRAERTRAHATFISLNLSGDVTNVDKYYIVIPLNK